MSSVFIEIGLNLFPHGQSPSLAHGIIDRPRFALLTDFDVSGESFFIPVLHLLPI